MQITPRTASSRTWARCQILVPSPSWARSDTSAESAMKLNAIFPSRGFPSSGFPSKGSGRADYAVGHTRPPLGRAHPPAVDEYGDPRQVRRPEALIVRVVRLDNGGVRRLA